MDFFNFDWFVRVFNEFKPERVYYRIQDISYGKENFAVSCVNSLDKNYPEYVEYSRIRIPQSNVKINTGMKLCGKILENDLKKIEYQKKCYGTLIPFNKEIMKNLYSWGIWNFV